MSRFDLMLSVNLRGTFATTQACLPFLLQASNAHVLVLSPPLDLVPAWFGDHCAYTISKYGMSMCVLGMAEEFRAGGVAVNALWPRTMIDTAASKHFGLSRSGCRTPEIMADAAHAIFVKDSRSFTGNFCIDEEVFKEAGVKDFEKYAVVLDAPLTNDLFVR
jgi:citronellol/citronellal dehydrogenase